MRRPTHRIARAAAHVQDAVPPRQTGGDSVAGERSVPQVWIDFSWNHALAYELRQLCGWPSVKYTSAHK